MCLSHLNVIIEKRLTKIDCIKVVQDQILKSRINQVWNNSSILSSIWREKGVIKYISTEYIVQDGIPKSENMSLLQKMMTFSDAIQQTYHLA